MCLNSIGSRPARQHDYTHQRSTCSLPSNGKIMVSSAGLKKKQELIMLVKKKLSAHDTGEMDSVCVDIEKKLK